MANYYVTSIKGIYRGGAGNDNFIFQQRNVPLYVNELIAGGTGTDSLVFQSGVPVAIVDNDFRNKTSLEKIDMSASTLTSSSMTLGTLAQTTGITSVIGSAGADTVNASAYTTIATSINGGSGNDVITGGALNDTLIGGNGNDNLTGGSGNDVINGGDNQDSIYAGTGADAVTLTVDGDTDVITQNEGDSVGSTTTLTGNFTVNDTITFGNGVDVVNDFLAGATSGGGDRLNIGTPISVSLLDESTDTTVIGWLSGNYNAGTKTFTITANGSGADTLVLKGSTLNASTSRAVILVGVDTDNLVASNFGGTDGVNVIPLYGTPSANAFSLLEGSHSISRLFVAENGRFYTTSAYNVLDTHVAPNPATDFSQAAMVSADFSNLLGGAGVDFNVNGATSDNLVSTTGTKGDDNFIFAAQDFGKTTVATVVDGGSGGTDTVVLTTSAGGTIYGNGTTAGNNIIGIEAIRLTAGSTDTVILDSTVNTAVAVTNAGATQAATVALGSGAAHSFTGTGSGIQTVTLGLSGQSATTGSGNDSVTSSIINAKNSSVSMGGGSGDSLYLNPTAVALGGTISLAATAAADTLGYSGVETIVTGTTVGTSSLDLTAALTTALAVTLGTDTSVDANTTTLTFTGAGNTATVNANNIQDGTTLTIGASSANLIVNDLLADINVGASTGTTTVTLKDADAGAVTNHLINSAATITVNNGTAATNDSIALSGAGDKFVHNLTAGLTLNASNTGTTSIDTSTTSVGVTATAGAGNFFVDATNLAGGNVLTLTTGAADRTATITHLQGDVDAANLSSLLDITLTNGASSSITLGSNNSSISGGDATGTISVDATATEAANTVTISGASTYNVTDLKAKLTTSATNGVNATLKGSLGSDTLTVTNSDITTSTLTVTNGTFAADDTIHIAGAGRILVNDLTAKLIADASADNINNLVTVGNANQSLTNLSGTELDVNVAAASGKTITVENTSNTALAFAGIDDSNTFALGTSSGAISIDASDLATAKTIGLTGSGAAVTITHMDSGNLSAAGYSNNITVTAGGDVDAQAIAVGSGTNTINFASVNLSSADSFTKGGGTATTLNITGNTAVSTNALDGAVNIDHVTFANTDTNVQVTTQNSNFTTAGAYSYNAGNLTTGTLSFIGTNIGAGASFSVTGGAGADLLTGGAGNDTLVGGLGGDNLQGAEGNDSISAGGDTDNITAGTGADTITLSVDAATDTINQAASDSIAATAVSLDANFTAGNTISFGDGVDVIYDFLAGATSGGGDQLLIGTTLSTGLLGQANNTTLIGWLSGSYSGGVFTIAANGVGLDTLVLQGSTLTGASRAVVLKGVDSDNLVNSNFGGADGVNIIPLYGTNAFTVQAGSTASGALWVGQDGKFYSDAYATLSTDVSPNPATGFSEANMVSADFSNLLGGYNLTYRVASANTNLTSITGTNTGITTIDAFNDQDLSRFTTFSAIDAITLGNDVNVTATIAQNALITGAAGNNTVTLSEGGSATAAAGVEAYNLAAAGNALTLVAGGTNVNGNSGDDTVAVGTLGASGTLALGAGTNNTVSLGDNGSLADATTGATGTWNLTLADNASVTLRTNNLTGGAGVQLTNIVAGAAETITVNTTDGALVGYLLNSAVETWKVGTVGAVQNNSVNKNSLTQAVIMGDGNDSLNLTNTAGTYSGAINLGGGTNTIFLAGGAGTYGLQDAAIANVDATSTNGMAAGSYTLYLDQSNVQNIAGSILFTDGGGADTLGLDNGVYDFSGKAITFGTAGSTLDLNALGDDDRTVTLNAADINNVSAIIGETTANKVTRLNFIDTTTIAAGVATNIDTVTIGNVGGVGQSLTLAGTDFTADNYTTVSGTGATVLTLSGLASYDLTETAISGFAWIDMSAAGVNTVTLDGASISNAAPVTLIGDGTTGLTFTTNTTATNWTLTAGDFNVVTLDAGVDLNVSNLFLSNTVTSVIGDIGGVETFNISAYGPASAIDMSNIVTTTNLNAINVQDGAGNNTITTSGADATRGITSISLAGGLNDTVKINNQGLTDGDTDEVTITEFDVANDQIATLINGVSATGAGFVESSVIVPTVLATGEVGEVLARGGLDTLAILADTGAALALVNAYFQDTGPVNNGSTIVIYNTGNTLAGLYQVNSVNAVGGEFTNIELVGIVNAINDSLGAGNFSA